MADKFNDFEPDITTPPSADLQSGRTEVKLLGLLPVLVLISLIFIRLIFLIVKYRGQKTRTPQQRRPYMGTRGRPSLTQQEPTIYVSPANLPPPPKYEAMAPPSYEEVVGVHYPGYQPPGQPITAPITTAMAQANGHTSTNQTSDSNNQIPNSPPTVITVTPDTRTTVNVATS